VLAAAGRLLARLSPELAVLLMRDVIREHLVVAVGVPHVPIGAVARFGEE
jgi:hypothetical protein